MQAQSRLQFQAAQKCGPESASVHRRHVEAAGNVALAAIYPVLPRIGVKGALPQIEREFRASREKETAARFDETEVGHISAMDQFQPAFKHICAVVEGQFAADVCAQGIFFPAAEAEIRTRRKA